MTVDGKVRKKFFTMFLGEPKWGLKELFYLSFLRQVPKRKGGVKSCHLS